MHVIDPELEAMPPKFHHAVVQALGELRLAGVGHSWMCADWDRLYTVVAHWIWRQRYWREVAGPHMDSLPRAERIRVIRYLFHTLLNDSPGFTEMDDRSLEACPWD